MFEFTRCSNSQKMTDRKELGKGQPIRVLPHGSATFRTEINFRIVRNQTAMTKRHRVVLLDCFTNFLVPGIGSFRSLSQPARESPDGGKQKPEQGDYADHYFRV